jgi:uncharacterized membrane protein
MPSAFPLEDGTRFIISGIVILIIIAFIPVSAQEEGYSSVSLFVVLFADGDALVEYDMTIDEPLAEEIRVNLFGEDIRDLIVVDYEDNAIEFNSGDTPNEIVFNAPSTQNLKISYATSDFLSKDRREWIFRLNSTVGFSVKLPPDSILTDPGENPSIALVGDQQLLTYKPGNTQFVYVIGALGTQEQANIVIKAAQTTIGEINGNHPGIVLTSATHLLSRAMDARDGGRFTDAERFAELANDAAIATSRDYVAAQEAIANADAQINSVSDGRGSNNNGATRQMLDQANIELASGNYVEAINLARNTITATLDERPTQLELALPLLIAGVAGGVGVLGTIVLLRKKKEKGKGQQQQQQEKEELYTDQLPLAHKVDGVKTQTHDNNRGAALFNRSPLRMQEKQQEQNRDIELHKEITRSAEETTSTLPYIPSAISGSQIDSSILWRIVGNILVEKPYLRPEDQQVLKFLAEKEGAVFESEIRSRFQLPKTTIWRLVKRLEREELVEIRKAGGQNLIKLMFEEKQV